MSFVPEKHPECPRMAPEKYGMYGTSILLHSNLKMFRSRVCNASLLPGFNFVLDTKKNVDSDV